MVIRISVVEDMIMWICLNNGYLSAVQSEDNYEVLVVRARAREHLEDNFPEHDIIDWEGTDYLFRIYITKTEFAEFLFDKALAIEYDNFKNSVTDKKLHNMYVSFWNAAYRTFGGKLFDRYRN